jgi:hypothetical protein
MANKKISELTPLNATPDANDILPLNDTSVGTTFSVTVSELQAATQALASNLTDISTIAQANGTMIASNGTNFVSLGTIDSTGLTAIRADLGLGTAATTASTDYATAAQGATADSATQPSDNISTLTNDSNFIDSSGAPVQSVAGRTGTVTLSNTDVSGLGTAALLDSGTSNGNVVVLDATGLPAVDGSQLTGISSAVDGTAVTSTGETGATKFLREDGDGTCSFQNVVVGDAELRGTDNPHIGAFPNQSFLVTDNPNKSVMVIANANGNLEFLVNSDSAKLYLTKPGSREEITTGVSVVEDSTEPDIEITTTSGTYSLITGDSDALGTNGLPVRQGFNTPDIGANQAPLLISGGTIS